MKNSILGRDIYCIIAERDGGMFDNHGSFILEQYTSKSTLEHCRERSEQIRKSGHRLVCRLVPVELHHLDGSITKLEEFKPADADQQ